METNTATGLMLIAGAINFCLWLVCAYWQMMLIFRINEVAKTQHTIPGNVPWMVRSRQALEADMQVKKLWRIRNICFVVTFSFMVITGLLIGYAIFQMTMS